jgi:hypothetical protein
MNTMQSACCIGVLEPKLSAKVGFIQGEGEEFLEGRHSRRCGIAEGM